MKHGLVGFYSAACFVHLKVASGRVNGRQFGYSQIVNPFYLHGKGSVPEPGEWALLITVLGFLLFLKFRSFKSKNA